MQEKVLDTNKCRLTVPPTPNDDWWRKQFRILQGLIGAAGDIEPHEVYPKLGAWPVLKLVWMRYAFGFYLPIMRNRREEGQFDRLHFVDTCAGSGLTSVPIGGKQEVLPGSAIIGANAEDFDFYHFVEPHRRRAEVLRKRISTVLQEDSFEVYDSNRADAVAHIAQRMRSESVAPHYMCFVDPEGFTEITLPQLRPFFALPRGDFFFNFQHMGVKRAVPSAVAFLGRPELALRLPSMSPDEIVEEFRHTLAAIGRPKTMWIPVEHGDNPYAYGMMYAAAETGSGNTWLTNFEREVRKRMAGVDGQRLGGILAGERSFDSLRKDSQRNLDQF